MLLDHPNAEAIFAASELLEQFRSSLKTITNTESPNEQLLQSLALITEMHRLNDERFEGSNAIHEALVQLEILSERIASMDITEKSELDDEFWNSTLHPLLLILESAQDGFGCCMI